MLALWAGVLMSEPKPSYDAGAAQATRKEMADHARAHYEHTSLDAMSWCSTIPHAIDAWEREPVLGAELAELRSRYDALVRNNLDYIKEVAELREANRFICVDSRLPEKWYSDLGDELIVFKPGFTDMLFPAKWDNDAQEFFTGGFGKPVHQWDGITHWRPMPAPPETP